ncbi:AAA family ATPase, partial [Mesorhizobium sp. M7A.F.Ca.CA.001.10.2.1]
MLPGTSLIFVGSNGGGKTRLAVEIENQLQLRAHRISAHRALTLNPAVAKITERNAKLGLRTGNSRTDANLGHRVGSRWRGDMATGLLNDFDVLLQALFADQTNKTLQTHQRVRAGDAGAAEPTKFELLAGIWQRLLPHRRLVISGDDIRVQITGSQTEYNAKDMSDGERSVFYMIGQVLAADPDTLLIFDEPELHVHRSIMAKLWDEMEAARPDCAFIFITHDLEFAASRVAQKIVIRDYNPKTGWVIEPVPEETGFDEQIATLILGSRRPILFVEGGSTSLDTVIYRCCYPEWTVIPRGSCEEVIHSVVTMRANADLTRVTCSGIVDADDYSGPEIANLARLGVAVLPVSEIENV